MEYEASLPEGQRYTVTVRLPSENVRPAGFDALAYAERQLDLTRQEAVRVSGRTARPIP